jgi:Chromo (CHRromatin Organisation MOdifier) domain
MFRYFTENGTQRWIDVVQQLTFNYNNSKHRSIKCTPAEVDRSNEHTIRDRLFPEAIVPTKSSKQYAIGDEVRISKFKHAFSKGYKPNWSEETFVIASCLRRPELVYRLKDLQNEPIIGTFYHDELQRIERKSADDKNGDEKVYKIERELRKRFNKKTGTAEVFVKWVGYPNKFNSWVKATNLVSVS